MQQRYEGYSKRCSRPGATTLSLMTVIIICSTLTHIFTVFTVIVITVFMLSSIMLCAMMIDVVMLSVVMLKTLTLTLSGTTLNAILLGVIMLGGITPIIIMLTVIPHS